MLSSGSRVPNRIRRYYTKDLLEENANGLKDCVNIN